MVRLFAFRAGRLLLGIWLIIMVTSISGINLIPAASKNPAHGGGGGSGGGTKSSCTTNTPLATVENNWAWGQTGSWGLPGQQVAYDIQVTNYDIGCASSTFAVSVSTPSGFAVSMPTNTISLASSSSGYIWAYVTSPATAADGDYPITVTIARAGTATSSSSYYKVYSTDTQAPTLFWPNPWDGATVTGHSYTVTVSSSDDHAVKNIDLYIDNAYVTTTSCDDITYICQLTYQWSTSAGQHSITFKSYDWMGNVGVLTVTFAVS
jgi:Big-like domain-containing protein